MDIKAALDIKLKKQVQIVEEINALAEKRQRLIEEALRSEGEIRLLKEMAAVQSEKGHEDA